MVSKTSISNYHGGGNATGRNLQ
jgi:hypothetical protein